MKKHFILILIIFAMNTLFTSCVGENNAVSDTANTTKLEENLNNTVDGTNSSDETSITQIGDFIITTPIEQEAIQNEDGTIILPNGSIYEYSGDKYTALNAREFDL